MEERQCPAQILLGSMDPDFCILLNVGVYLEDMLGRFPNCTYLFTDSTTAQAPKNLIQTFWNRLERTVWNDADFKALQDESTDAAGVEHTPTGSLHRTMPVDVDAALMK